jgi:hypothetical protein
MLKEKEVRMQAVSVEELTKRNDDNAANSLKDEEEGIGV